MKGYAKVGSETRFSRKFLVNVTCFFVFFSGLLVWIVLILVWFERSLYPAQVRGRSCPWPLKLMASQAVEGTWIRTGGYGRFRGEWVKSFIPRLKANSGHLFWNRIADFSNIFSFKFLRKWRLYITVFLNIENRADIGYRRWTCHLVSKECPWEMQINRGSLLAALTGACIDWYKIK